jgi:hypothetical protein
MMTKRRPRKSKRAPVPLNIVEHDRVRAALLARLVTSTPWAEELVGAIDRGEVDLFVSDSGHLKADFQKVEKALRRAGAYPPGGIMTLMHHCPRCDHWTPCGYVEKGLDDQCEECAVSEAPSWLWSQWPASPSANAIQRARILGVRLKQGRLG